MVPDQRGQSSLLQAALVTDQTVTDVLIGPSSTLRLRQLELWLLMSLVMLVLAYLSTQEGTIQDWTDAIDMAKNERLD